MLWSLLLLLLLLQVQRVQLSLLLIRLRLVLKLLSKVSRGGGTGTISGARNIVHKCPQEAREGPQKWKGLSRWFALDE